MIRLPTGAGDRRRSKCWFADWLSAGTLDEPVTHPGEEFVHCLSGEINYCVQDEVYHMAEGSSLLFNATQPHCFHNAADVPATLIIVFQSENGMDLARKRHLSEPHASDGTADG